MHVQTPLERKVSASGSPLCVHLCLCLRACVRASPALVWDVQLSGSATGGECWSVSLFDPSLPPHITTWEILIGLIPSYVLYFIPSSALLSNPALPLVSPFLGTQLSKRPHSKNLALQFKVNVMQTSHPLCAVFSYFFFGLTTTNKDSELDYR